MTTQVRPKNVADHACHEGQTHGHGIGVDQNMAEHMKSQTGPVVRATHKPLVGTGSFSISPAKGADGFGHSGGQKQGVLRNSGSPGAHRLGKKK